MLLCRLIILFVSLSLPAPGPQSSSVQDTIAKIRSEWARDMHEKRPEELVLLYAPDAVFILPNGERVTGRQDIRELCKKVMAIFTSDLTFHSISSEDSVNLAYDSGDYRETLLRLADGSTLHSQGSYLMVFKRQPDGKWLIAQQVWTGSEPASN
jgi:ketosteroid isomerase-like protein